MLLRSTSIAIASSSAETGTGRALARLALLALWSLTAFLSLAAGTLVLFPIRGGRRAVRRFMLRRWAIGVTRILGVRITVEGSAPRAPFYLVSNHLGYLDVVVYAAVMPVRFVAKREVRYWPVVGLLARTVGTIFIDRTVKRDVVRVLDDVAGALADGDGVIVFAEATSSPGATVLPFRSALLEWAARANQPVHYASLAYRTPAGGPPAYLAVCWWGEMTFGRHLVGLSRLPWIGVTVRHGPGPIAEADRKRLAERLHLAVSEQFIPVV